MKTNKPTTPADASPSWKPIDELASSVTVLMRDADGVQHRGYLFHGVFHNVNGITIHAYTPVEFTEVL